MLSRPLALLLVLLTTALLAACGGDSPKQLVAGATKAADDAESYRMTTVVDAKQSGEAIAMKGEITSTADQKRSRFDGTFAQGGPAKEMELIIVDGVNYARGELLGGALPKGKEWLRMEAPVASTSMTPAEFLDYLEQAPEIEDVGTETVRGEETTHLSGPLDVKRLIEKTNSELAKQFSQLPDADQMKADIDVWVEKDDTQLRRMKLRMTHPKGDTTMTMSGDILEWDVPTDDIKAPPKDEVVDASELGG
jgi:outer membrane lipoprotein-sorting protein